MKPKILLSAFACDPVTGSEPYVGWNWALMLAGDYDVHVLTRAYSRKLIAGDPAAGDITFHFVDYLGVERHNHHWRYIKPYYVLWQLLVVRKVLALTRLHDFKVVHHVTYNNIDVPGFLWLVPGARFIWGPVGGGQTAPPSLAVVYGKSWWKERIRSLLKASARYNPIIRNAVRRAALVLIANQETADRLAGLRFRSALVSETAIRVDGIETVSPRRPGRVRLLWLSHVFPRKGLTLAVDGFKSALDLAGGRVAMELIVIGDGEALESARRLAAHHGMADVAFMGAVPHADVNRYMTEADIFLFTSLQDTSGNVLLEAMRNAKPIIALNHQGAKALVTGGGGRLVDIGSYAETAARLGTAMVELASDPALRETMGRAARREVEQRHTWAAKRTQVLQLYAEVVACP